MYVYDCIFLIIHIQLAIYIKYAWDIYLIHVNLSSSTARSTKSTVFFLKGGFCIHCNYQNLLAPNLTHTSAPYDRYKWRYGAPQRPKINGFHWGDFTLLMDPMSKNHKKTGDFGVTLPSQVPFFGWKKMFGNPHSNMEITINHEIRIPFKQPVF